MHNSGLEIATHWSPMQPKIEHWRLNFHKWSQAGDSQAHFNVLFICCEIVGSKRHQGKQVVKKEPGSSSKK